MNSIPSLYIRHGLYHMSSTNNFILSSSAKYTVYINNRFKMHFEYFGQSLYQAYIMGLEFKVKHSDLLVDTKSLL